MKHSTFNLIVILSLFSTAVNAQSPGGIAGFVKWVNGNDNTPVQLTGAGGLTFIGVGKIQKEGEQLLWNVSTQAGKTERVQTTLIRQNEMYRFDKTKCDYFV